jgi:hypothetical protein
MQWQQEVHECRYKDGAKKYVGGSGLLSAMLAGPPFARQAETMTSFLSRQPPCAKIAGFVIVPRQVLVKR